MAFDNSVLGDTNPNPIGQAEAAPISATPPTPAVPQVAGTAAEAAQQHAQPTPTGSPTRPWAAILQGALGTSWRP